MVRRDFSRRERVQGPVVREPFARNSYGCPSKLWRKLSQEERNFYNKFYRYILFTKEEYFDTVLTDEEWKKASRKLALRAVDTMRRGRSATHWRQY